MEASVITIAATGSPAVTQRGAPPACWCCCCAKRRRWLRIEEAVSGGGAGEEGGGEGGGAGGCFGGGGANSRSSVLPGASAPRLHGVPGPGVPGPGRAGSCWECAAGLYCERPGACCGGPGIGCGCPGVGCGRPGVCSGRPPAGCAVRPVGGGAGPRSSCNASRNGSRNRPLPGWGGGCCVGSCCQRTGGWYAGAAVCGGGAGCPGSGSTAERGHFLAFGSGCCAGPRSCRAAIPGSCSGPIPGCTGGRSRHPASSVSVFTGTSLLSHRSPRRSKLSTLCVPFCVMATLHCSAAFDGGGHCPPLGRPFRPPVPTARSEDG